MMIYDQLNKQENNKQYKIIEQQEQQLSFSHLHSAFSTTQLKLKHQVAYVAFSHNY
ncbi:unnamed protein product [Paramecium octaurelia]|uniref:Uncharacterized protein n=1 Tax=Paramecium octaurelia TaxID=43137 RepID=A0A8S1T6Q4_PAROT|nr:unnamed protein product [Paramecium octaurelia]